MLKKLYRSPGPIRWTILEKEVVDGVTSAGQGILLFLGVSGTKEGTKLISKIFYWFFFPLDGVFPSRMRYQNNPERKRLEFLHSSSFNMALLVPPGSH
jgi:hypothetical protein